MNITKTILMLTIASTFLNAAVKKDEKLQTNFDVEIQKGTYSEFTRKEKEVKVIKETYSANAEAIKNHNIIMKLIESGDLKQAKTIAFEVMTNVSKIAKVGEKRESAEKRKKAEENIETVEYALALVDMGEIEKYFGNYDKALGYHEKAYNMYNNLRGVSRGSQIDGALSAKYIIDTFIRNDINVKIVKVLVKESTVLINKTYGDKSEESGDIYLAQAKALFAQSKIDDGEKAFIEVEKKYYRTPGYNSLKYAMIDIEKGYQYMLVGNFDDAERSINKSIVSVEKKLKKINPNHFMLGDIYKHQALIYMGSSKYNAAIEKYIASLTIFNATIGIQNRTAAAIYNNLGVSYKNINKDNEAIDCFKRGLAINAKVLGERTHEVATLYNNLASVYYKIGQKNEALTNLKQAYAINISLYGKGNKKTQTIAENIKLVQEEITIKDNILLKIIAPKIEIK